MGRILIYATVLILFLISLFSFSRPVLAASAISITPATGTPGTTVTITGTGFDADEMNIEVKFDSTSLESDITASGTGTWTTNFVVPSVASGVHTVTAIGTNTVTAGFSVTPSISIDETSGQLGTSITITGSGFAINEAGINITFDGAAVLSGITAGTLGTWSGTFTIPASSSGPHAIDASGSVTQAATVPDLSFTVSSGITINKTNGPPGTSVTVTGSGFGANETGITVTYDNSSVGQAVSANAKGEWTASFTIPASPSGTHQVSAYGPKTPASGVPSVAFTSSAGISLSKNSGAQGTSISVTGSGFDSGEDGISVVFDDFPVAEDITANTGGSWKATFIVPNASSGPHAISASGPVTQSDSIAEIKFTITASITLDPPGGPPGTSISVTGSGFAANEKGIVVTYNNSPAASNITADAQGGWNTAFTVPNSPGGSHSISAYGPATRANIVPAISFIAGAGISVNNDIGSPGAPITVNGFGFVANEKGITINYDNFPVATNISANAQGGWNASFMVPVSPGGNHTIDAFGTTTRDSSINDLTFTTVPGVSISPISGNVGTKATLSGSGFGPNIPIKLKYDGMELTGVTGTSDSKGNINKTIVIPKSTSGTHTIEIVDSQNGSIGVDFEMESVPPPIPRLLSPGDGIRAGFFQGADLGFKWSGVTDVSGVTYTLEVDDNPDFTQPLLSKVNLSGTSYTPTSAEALKDGEYYWRVKAVDGASNASEWSPTWMVRPGMMAMWALILIILAGILIIGAVAYYWLVRRKFHRLEAIPVPENEAINIIPGQWRAIETEPSPKPRALPFRVKALPQGSRGAKPFSPEQQAKLKVIANFAQNLPLIEPSYDADWLLELVESGMDTSLTASVPRQILDGSLPVRYDPNWQRHPLYEEMAELLKDQPVLQNLNLFVESVNQCAYESASLIREIYTDTKIDIPPEALNGNDWDFVSSVYADTMSWFMGKSLQAPSEKDYVMRTDQDNGDHPGMFELWGADSTPFATLLVTASGDADIERSRNIHMRLRRMYRSNNRTKQIVSMITQLEVQRSKLLRSFSQLAGAMQ